jgi:acetyl-CoA carboxylase biotin carboxyl carrier protein
MNLKEIKEIIDLMNQNELTEIEIEREGVKLKIKKSSLEAGETIVRRPVEVQVSPVPITPAIAPTLAAPTPGKATKTIASPMVGTFYRAPSPEAPPFVDVGQIIEVGQVVCIVEAMKLMNEIKAEVKGKIVEVAVENAEPVEFGQTLFVLEPV